MFEVVDPASKCSMVLKPIFGCLQRGEGIDGVGVSCLRDFEDSPFSDFVEEWVSFFLGAIEELFESMKGKE